MNLLLLVARISIAKKLYLESKLKLIDNIFAVFILFFSTPNNDLCEYLVIITYNRMGIGFIFKAIENLGESFIK